MNENLNTMRMDRGQLLVRIAIYLFAAAILLLLLTKPVFAVDLSGAINQANSEFNATLSPLPKLLKPLFYVSVAVISIIVSLGFAAKWVENKNDEAMAAKQKKNIIWTVAIGVIISICAPAFISVYNLIYGTSFQW